MAIFFITGTDTAAGKTVLTALLARHFSNAGISVAALKPVCSGGRDDARALLAATDGPLALDEINPWHFRAPLSPLLAARREKRKLSARQVLGHIRKIRKKFPVVLVEGAGGLLSPLGENFDSRDLILALRATPVVVCPNRLGAINQALLVLAALPPAVSRRAQLVLMSPEKTDAASHASAQLLADRLGAARLHVFPWLKFPAPPAPSLASRPVLAAVGKLARSLGL